MCAGGVLSSLGVGEEEEPMVGDVLDSTSCGVTLGVMTQRTCVCQGKILTQEQKASFEAGRIHAQNSPPNINDVMRLTAEIDFQSHKAGRRCLCMDPGWR